MPGLRPLLSDHQPEPIAAPTPVRLRVLVVDDSAINRELAGSYVRAAGHEVAFAEDGEQAIAAAAASDFDFVLMDVAMSTVDGLEATRRIRALPGPRGQVAVVALTVQVLIEQVEACRAAGMDGHVAKPFTMHSLCYALARGAAAGQFHSSPQPLPEPPAAPPIFDLAAFERTAGFLKPEVVASYMAMLGARSEALLSGLGAPAADAGTLATEAHTLAGSAGMFGFVRLASDARRFEQLNQTRPGLDAEVPAFARELGLTITASAHEMHRRAHAAQKVAQ